MLPYQKHHHPFFVFRRLQPNGDFVRNLFADHAVVTFASLGDVVKNQRYVQRSFVPETVVGRTDRSLVVRKRHNFIDGLKRMFVHREAVVLVELHQAPNLRHRRHKPIQHSGFVHSPQRQRQTVGGTQYGAKEATRFSTGLGRQVGRSFADDSAQIG